MRYENESIEIEKLLFGYNSNKSKKDISIMMEPYIELEIESDELPGLTSKK